MPELMPDRTADAAFAELLQLHRARTLAFLRRLSTGDAEDLLQETMVRAWRYREGCDLAGNAAAWLLQVAFRTFLDHRQRHSRQVAADEVRVRESAAVRPDAMELREEVERALRGLSPLQRELLLGFHQEQLSLQELARRHRLPMNTVKSHLHRARQRLVRPDQEER
jgi:RNA polymerase sigma-70 factor (ECF subfamily)